MRHNDNQRQQSEQLQGRKPQGTQQPPTQQPPAQQPPTQQPPTQQPPAQQPPSMQQPPQQSPQNLQGQPPQLMQSSQPPQGMQSQGQNQPPQGQSPPPQSGHGGPQQGGQQFQQPPQGAMQSMQQSPPQGSMQSGMMGQQGQMQQMGPQPGMGVQQPQQMVRGQTHLHSVSLDEILRKDVVTAQPDTPIPTITAQMAEKDVGSVVIVDDEKPVGLLTDRKIALALEEMPDLNERTAEELMSGEMVTGSDKMSVYEALQQMSDESIRRLPVTDDEGKLVGIVTLDDIIVLLGTELQDVAEIIQAQSPRL